MRIEAGDVRTEGLENQMVDPFVFWIQNLARHMNVLYSAGPKCQPLGSQALSNRRTDVQKLFKKRFELFNVTAILVLQKIWFFVLIIKSKHFNNCVITGQNRCLDFWPELCLTSGSGRFAKALTDRQTDKQTHTEN